MVGFDPFDLGAGAKHGFVGRGDGGREGHRLAMEFGDDHALLKRQSRIVATGREKAVLVIVCLRIEPEAMMVNSNVFIIGLLVLMRAAADCPDDIARVVASAPWRAPHRNHASLAVGLRAVEAAPGVAADRNDAPTKPFSISDRFLYLFVGMALPSHPLFAICEQCLHMSTRDTPLLLSVRLMAGAEVLGKVSLPCPARRA